MEDNGSLLARYYNDDKAKGEPGFQDLFQLCVESGRKKAECKRKA